MKKALIITTLVLLAVTITCGMAYDGINTSCSIDKDKVRAAKTYCVRNGLRTDVAIFVDFSKPRIFRRSYVYDLRQDKILRSSLCPTGLAKHKFSNRPGSYLSSLGRYRVTDKTYKMRIGYQGIVVQGMEATNSKAEGRKILIHSYKYVNVFSMFSRNLSWGCFVIDGQTYKKIKSLRKPVLLWAYQ